MLAAAVPPRGGGFHSRGLWVDEVGFEGPGPGSLAVGRGAAMGGGGGAALCDMGMGAGTCKGGLTREKMLFIFGRVIRNNGIGWCLHIYPRCDGEGAQIQHQASTFYTEVYGVAISHRGFWKITDFGSPPPDWKFRVNT